MASLFLERFWREFRIFCQVPQTSQNLQNWRWYFDLLMTFSSPCSGLILQMRSTALCQNKIKINRPVKTPWRRPSMRVARCMLWAPGMCLFKSASSACDLHTWVTSSVDLIIYWFQFQFFFRSMLSGRLAWHVLSTPLLQCWGISTGVSNSWRFELFRTQTTAATKNGGF